MDSLKDFEMKKPSYPMLHELIYKHYMPSLMYEIKDENEFLDIFNDPKVVEHLLELKMMNKYCEKFPRDPKTFHVIAVAAYNGVGMLYMTRGSKSCKSTSKGVPLPINLDTFAEKLYKFYRSIW